MDDFRELARDPKHRRRFERMLYLAAQRGDADLVAERLSWGIDPNCTFAKSRTPLIANVRESCPSAATVRALLAADADPSPADETGLTALDYARRKLISFRSPPLDGEGQGGVRSHGRFSTEGAAPRKSPSLDENNQVQLGPEEQQDLDQSCEELRQSGSSPEHVREYRRVYLKERLRAAGRVFNDPEQFEEVVAILDAVDGPA